VTQAEALWQADDRLARTTRLGRYAIFHQARHSASALVSLDSFYLGFRHGDERIVFPYNWDGEEFDDPNVNAFAPDGLTAWIVRNKRTYVSWSDGGALLHRGRAFGDTSRRSSVGVVVPLRESQRVIGVLAALSYRSDAIGPEDVPALERLGELTALYLARERQDRERFQAYGLARPPESSPRISETLRRLRKQSVRLRGLLAEGTEARALADGLCELCAQAQSESMETPGERTLEKLTPREREVAVRLARSQSNAEIAEALSLSSLTVKTHVANILRKLAVTGRSGVRERLKNTPME
jgi:DNA-binding CsgD family transcriptional regulator